MYGHFVIGRRASISGRAQCRRGRDFDWFGPAKEILERLSGLPDATARAAPSSSVRSSRDQPRPLTCLDEESQYARDAVSSLREYREMRQLLRQSDGAVLQSDLQGLKRGLGVLLGNCEELLGFLSSTDDPLTAIRLWAVQNREGFERHLDEVDRLLHNVVAAAMSLREHSYRVRDRWLQADQRDNLREEYNDRARQVFRDSWTAQFVAGLRIIVQHRKLPRLLGYAEHVPGQAFISKIVLDTADVLQVYDWNAAMRASLEARDEPIALDEIVTEYRDAVVGFHGWFVSALRERNAQALRDFELGRRELSAYASRLFGHACEEG
jgi:hypothetical protein